MVSHDSFWLSKFRAATNKHYALRLAFIPSSGDNMLRIDDIATRN